VQREGIDEPDHEDERRQAEEGERDRVRRRVELAARCPRGVHRQRERDAERDELADPDDLEVDREVLGEDRRDALPRDLGDAEISVQDVVEPRPVLLEQRPVEPQLSVEDRSGMGRIVEAENDLRGVARDEVDQEEAEDGDAEDHDDERQESLNDVPEHHTPRGDPPRRIVNSYNDPEPPRRRHHLRSAP
jgi:hypothetical protein